MALSKVQIANMALSHLGNRNNITSLTENSQEASSVNTWYEHSKVMALEAFDWSFARKRITLSDDAEDPPEAEWQFRYQYPSDCLKARRMENAHIINQSIVRGIPLQLVEPDAIPFTIELATDGTRKTILTDMKEAVLVYTADVNDVNLFTRRFAMAFTYGIAYNIAFQLTGKSNIKQSMYEQYLFTLNDAAAEDGNESVDRPPRDADWIRGRW